MTAPESNPPSYAEAREIVSRVEETREVIGLKRIGAMPYLRYTPYENNRGATVGLWSCISVSFDAMPGKTLLSSAHIVRPWELDDWEVNQIHSPWVVNQLTKTRRGRISIEPAEETPFAGEILRWDGRDGEVGGEVDG
jgi:hypothetical protein